MRRLRTEGLQMISDALGSMQARKADERARVEAQQQADARARQMYLASMLNGLPYDRQRQILAQNNAGLNLPEFEPTPEERLRGMATADSIERFPTLAPEIRNAGTYEGAYGKPIPKEALEHDILRQNLTAPDFAESNRVLGGIQMKPKEAAEETRLAPLTLAQTGKERAEAAFTQGPRSFQATASGKASLANAAESGARVPLIQAQTANTILERDPNSPLNAAKREKRDFTQTHSLRSDYLKEVKNWPEVQDSLSRVRAASNDPSGQSDMALIYAFMKMLDEGSVVRESEYAMAAKTGSILQRASATLNQVANGKKLSDAQRKEFVNVAERMIGAIAPRYQQIDDRYRATATKFGIDPNDILISAGGASPTQSGTRTTPDGKTWRKVSGGWEEISANPQR